MTEYWKSSAKKFCEICKVWFADNRASIEHHEMGAKHKAMVQKRLREMSKRANEKEADQGHLNATLIAMEQAALASMRQKGEAIPSSAGPQVRAAPRPVLPKVDPKQEAKERKRKIKELKKSSKQSQFWQEGEEEFIEWVQAEANGQTYYWNIFTQETEWEAPALFYTTEEYTTNYDTISQKVNELLKKQAEAQEKQPSPSPEIIQPEVIQPPVEEVRQKKPKQSSDFKSKSTSDPKKPTWFELNEQNKKQEAEFKKQVSSKRWDVRNLVTSDVVETVENTEDNVQTSSKYVEKFVETQPTSGLGPWIPITPKVLSTTELQKQDVKKVVIDDLPEQETNKKANPIFDEDEHGAETTFTDKKLPVTTSKKSKPVMFRKPKSKGTSVKQEYD